MGDVDSEAPAESWQPPLFAASTWVLIISTAILVFVYDHWCHQYLARLGFPGPKATPFFGHTFQWLSHKTGIQGFHDEYFPKYGKVFGIYAGWRGVVLIADADLVRLLCIKDFSSFVNRQPTPVDNKPFHKALTVLRDDHWKDVRSILSPTFSGSKMKLMTPLINDCLDPMIRKVRKHHEEGKSVQLKDIYGGYLIDAVGNCAFGLNINSQETENDPFLHYAKEIFTVKFNLVILILLFAPFLAPVFNYFNVTSFDRTTLNFFENAIDQAVDLRRSGGEKRVDFLQLMLDAQERTDEDKEQATEEERLEQEHREKITKKTLTMEELKSQQSSGRHLVTLAPVRDDVTYENIAKMTYLDGVICETLRGLTFFLAGYETSSTTMGFVSYLLAINPEAQDKLIAEIDTLAPGRDDVTYENIAKMTYLDGVICEALRVYPPAVFSARQTGQDYKFQGFTFPKGTEVFFSIWHIHHDPELWEDPEKFNPDRFAPEEREKRHPCAWIPFGVGPRNCIGMRFALLQVKMGLVRMLQNFRLETCEETEMPPVLGKFGFLTPPNGFKLTAVPRS